MYMPLKVPEWQQFAIQKDAQQSPMKTIGRLLDQVVVDNPKTFRIFSPDELVSNKLDAVFEHTGRNFQWDEASRNKGGRVIEMLSEHTLQGFLQGYTLTGRVGVFPSYESFLGIVHTMMVQFGKFAKMVGSRGSLRPTSVFGRLIGLRRTRHAGGRTLGASTTSRPAPGPVR